jgi:ABC-type Fe3+-hydroxamate transport system substrate-binding protein
MKTFTDQMGRTVNLPNSPKRIISLVPSQTELLFDLGLDVEVIGLTKFCIHPKGKIKEKTVIGGTKNFRFEQIDELKPDLIIGNKEENYQEGIEQLAEKYPVWMSDITNLESAYEMIEQVSELVGKAEKGKEMVWEIKSSFSALTNQQLIKSNRKTLYFIWKNPYMVAGKGTFIDEIMEIGGFENCTIESRYPSLMETQIQELQPETILLSSEPFPFKSTHIAEFQQLCPNTKIQIVDGELFSWYGSRLLKTAEYLKELM